MSKAADPVQKLKVACGVIFFIAAMNVLAGISAVLFRIEFLERLGLGLNALAAGLIYLGLGLWARQGSKLALALAAGLFLADGIYTAVVATEKLKIDPVNILIPRIILLIPLIRGFWGKAAKSEMND